MNLAACFRGGAAALSTLIAASCSYGDDLGSSSYTIDVDFEEGREKRARGEMGILPEDDLNSETAFLHVFADGDADREDGWEVHARLPLDGLEAPRLLTLTIVPPDPVLGELGLDPGQAHVGPIEAVRFDSATDTTTYPGYATEGTIRLFVDVCRPRVGGAVQTPSSELRAKFHGVLRRASEIDAVVCGR